VWAIAIILFTFSWRGSLNTYKVQNKAPWEEAFSLRGSPNKNSFLRYFWILRDNSDIPTPQNTQVAHPQDAKEELISHNYHQQCYSFHFAIALRWDE
jgi:hypothetical protein